MRKSERPRPQPPVSTKIQRVGDPYLLAQLRVLGVGAGFTLPKDQPGYSGPRAIKAEVNRIAALAGRELEWRERPTYYAVRVKRVRQEPDSST
jgi:hypothetical protein